MGGCRHVAELSCCFVYSVASRFSFWIALLMPLWRIIPSWTPWVLVDGTRQDDRGLLLLISAVVLLHCAYFLLHHEHIAGRDLTGRKRETWSSAMSAIGGRVVTGGIGGMSDRKRAGPKQDAAEKQRAYLLAKARHTRNGFIGLITVVCSVLSALGCFCAIAPYAVNNITMNDFWQLCLLTAAGTGTIAIMGARAIWIASAKSAKIPYVPPCANKSHACQPKTSSSAARINRLLRRRNCCGQPATVRRIQKWNCCGQKAGRNKSGAHESKAGRGEEAAAVSWNQNSCSNHNCSCGCRCIVVRPHRLDLLVWICWSPQIFSQSRTFLYGGVVRRHRDLCRAQPR